MVPDYVAEYINYMKLSYRDIWDAMHYPFRSNDISEYMEDNSETFVHAWLDRLISDLSDEDPDDDIVDDLDNCYQGLMEKYQLLYNGLPIAIDTELDWCNSNSGGVTRKDYGEGYIKGLKDAVDIFKQIRDQY